MSRRFLRYGHGAGRRVALAVTFATVLACTGSTGPAESVAVEQAEPVESPPPDVPPELCRDWSKADLDTLPALATHKYTALLDEVWRRVLEQHYDPTLGCIDWLEVRTRYGAVLAQTTSAAEAFSTINTMLGELKQSHFRLFSPSADDAAGPTSPEMAMRWVEDKLIVVSSTAQGHLGSVVPGSQVLAIGDVSVQELVGRARRRSRSDAEFPGKIARLAAAKLSCPRAGQSRKLKLVVPGPEAKTVVRMVECVEPKGERISLGNLTNIPSHVDSRMLPGTKTGYLAFNIWMLPLVKQIEVAVDKMRTAGMTDLIIDLRGNPGGVGPMAVPVARLLLDKSGSLGVLKMRAMEQNFRVEPARNPFDGRVVVLVDEGTASTSEIFATGLRDLERITIVGGRTSAGAALPSLIEQLDSGAVLQYVVGEYHSSKGSVPEGEGVTLDVKVAERQEDFAQGRDPVLEAALVSLEPGGAQ